MIFALAIVVLSQGCDESDNPTNAGAMTPQEMIREGWRSFEQYDNSIALDHFLEAAREDNRLSDAWNGAGWSAGRIAGKLNEADGYFSESFRLDTTRYDALGGWLFVAYQLGNWQAAIDKADSLLQRRSGWRFLHQPGIDVRDVRLTTAAAYYQLGEFSASLNVITTYLNTSFEADVDTPAGRRELLEEIERLRQIHG